MQHSARKMKRYRFTSSKSRTNEFVYPVGRQRTSRPTFEEEEETSEEEEMEAITRSRPTFIEEDETSEEEEMEAITRSRRRKKPTFEEEEETSEEEEMEGITRSRPTFTEVTSEEEEMEAITRSRRRKKKRVVDDANADESQENIGVAAGAESNKKENGMSAILMNPEVLECSICMEPLSPPVFQCENGHTACSWCYTNLDNKCKSCTLPIGLYRCLAIEKVIESIRVSCAYKTYGCEETFSYAHIRVHEETCMHAPCKCPFSNCDFRGSSKKLSLHADIKHRLSVIRFGYGCPFSVSFGKLEEYLVFREEVDGSLFVLSNQVEVNGSAITVACLGRSPSDGRFSYNLVARKGCSTLTLQSETVFIQERSEAYSDEDFLLVPYHFYSTSEVVLEICILNAQSEQVCA